MRAAVGNHPGLTANPDSDSEVDKFNLNVGHNWYRPFELPGQLLSRMVAEAQTRSKARYICAR